MAAAKSGAVAKAVTVDFPADIFGVEPNIPLIHQVVVAQQAAARQGTHATRTRGDVRGGGRKPYKQKGTGRARQGSVRAPQFAGGGTVHGPQPRSYDQRTPKKMKAAALRGALSDRASAGRVHVVESLTGSDKPSTRDAVAALNALTANRRQLVVLERDDAVTWLSLRNVADVHLLAVDQLNTYDVLVADDVVFTKGAYDTFVGGEGAGEAGTAAKASTPQPAAATTPETAAPVAEPVETQSADTDEPAAPALPRGAKAPLKSGGAPKGYEIKGNSESGKYHQPGGQWYDATVAEFYFKTAEAAEAAGFTEAGKTNSEDDK